MAYNSTLEGSQIVFQCSPGFVPSQQIVSVCAANNSWTPDPAELLCRGTQIYHDCLTSFTSGHLSYPADCGIPIIVDGSLKYTTTVEGSTATYQCDMGFVPEGVMTSICMESGEWAPDPAEVECTQPGKRY